MMQREIFLRHHFLEDKNLQTIYFGGGTPSLLSAAELANFFKEIEKYFQIDDQAEITLEANPDDLNKNYLQELKNLGINRLSIGIQSFFDEDLRLMNRAHNASMAEYSVKLAQDIGLENISLDLMYGMATSAKNIWQKNVEMALALQVPHISSYALTVEPRTALEKLTQKFPEYLPKEEQQEEDFFLLKNRLKAAGFVHYEISNFAQPGKFSRHNTAYWQNKAYLGIGPSAHSYNGENLRSWNVANNQIYTQQLLQNILPVETENLSNENRINEKIMLGLRTIFGFDETEILALMNDHQQSIYFAEKQKLLAESKIFQEGNTVKIPENFWFQADGIAATLFVAD